MKITRVEIFTVVVPLHEGSWHSREFVPEGYVYGGQWARLHTDKGRVGLGEAPRGLPEAAIRREAQCFKRSRKSWHAVCDTTT